MDTGSIIHMYRAMLFHQTWKLEIAHTILLPPPTSPPTPQLNPWTMSNLSLTTPTTRLPSMALRWHQNLIVKKVMPLIRTHPGRSKNNLFSLPMRTHSQRSISNFSLLMRTHLWWRQQWGLLSLDGSAMIPGQDWPHSSSMTGLGKRQVFQGYDNNKDTMVFYTLIFTLFLWPFSLKPNNKTYITLFLQFFFITKSKYFN